MINFYKNAYIMQVRFLYDIKEILHGWGIEESLAHILNITFSVLIILLIAFIADLVTKKIILSSIARIVKKTENTWDDIILERKVFDKLSHFAPALTIYYLIGYLFLDFPKVAGIIQDGVLIAMVIIALMVINSFLKALHEIYLTLDIAKDRSIKGYIQVAHILFYSIGLILILSIIIGKSPVTLLAGLGAMAAVLILVFKDTIQGFMASIQLSANDMLKIGDWITMPKYNADGKVTEITLNTVKVQNGDKTISTIPTYSLVTDSFNNWRGMEEAGVRRIKRYVNIDMRSVKFCTPEMLEKFKKIKLLKIYIEERQKEINTFNSENSVDETIAINGRRMTNLGVFRKYLEVYLKHHPLIHQELTFIIRHLQPTEVGIPIEILVFCKDNQLDVYENVQADIFDHILAAIPEFDLRVFQNPSGEDFKKLVN
jgi:miniconductance mechanosensitive channel